jgi:hypothetical protein
VRVAAQRAAEALQDVRLVVDEEDAYGHGGSVGWVFILLIGRRAGGINRFVREAADQPAACMDRNGVPVTRASRSTSAGRAVEGVPRAREPRHSAPRRTR